MRRWFAEVALTLLAGLVGAHVSISELAASNDSLDQTSTLAALEDGRYAEADRQAEAALSAVNASRDATSADVARAMNLLLEARIGNGRAAESETLAVADRLVRLNDTIADIAGGDKARSLRNLAAVQVERGDFTSALANANRALTLGAATWRPNDPARADALDVKAKALISLEQFENGRNVIAQSLAIRDQPGAGSPLALARSLRVAGLLEWNAGSYDSAAALLDRALATWESSAPNHPDKSWSLADRGYVFFLTGNIAAAEQRWTESLRLARETLRSDHPAIAHFLRNVGNAQFISGRSADARQSREMALRIGERSLARCAPELFWLINDNAGALQTDGEYKAARALYQRELSIAKACTNGNSSNTATATYNMASLAYEMGDWNEAERLAQDAAGIWANRLGAAHPYVARALDQVAEALGAQDNFAGALRLLNRALTIRRKAFGPRHPQIGWNLNEIADIEMKAGRIGAARKAISEAIDIYREPGVAGEPDELARALMLRGRIAMRTGLFGSAREDFTEALTTRRQRYGDRHPLVADAQAAGAMAEFGLSQETRPLESALTAEDTGREHLRFTIRYLPERPAMAYAAARPRGLDLALSMAAAKPSVQSSRILDAAVRSRGVVLDELAARAQSTAGDADPALAFLTAALVRARQQFATLMLRSLQGESVLPELLNEARRKKEDAERALAERNVAAREEAQRAQIGLDDVRRAMPAGSALISYVRYDRTSFVNRPSGRAVTTTLSYIAIVARAGSDDARVVPLGSASFIERLVDTWRAEAGGRAIAAGVAPREAERTYRAAATALRARVWDPLADSLMGASRVFIVPDGALNLVSFAALPAGNRYLLDNGPTIHYLATERDLVREGAADGRGLLALGGPAFDGRTTNAAPATQRSGCGTIGSLRFEDLPGSRAEVQDIARIWGERNDVLMLSGRAATKAALTKAIVGRKVIHLATHGFFLGANCDAPIPRTRGVGGIVGAARVSVDNPLLLSGLALAGVNTLSGARQSNGILNAEEIAGLNLQGTEWVVLSACDTGLGQIAVGEGVFGLRRALQIAGVHTIIMSLWSVEDESTRDWMKALYTARLAKQLDTPDAVRTASVQVLEERRKRGLSTHPFYWAAFVAAGDWR